MFTYICLKMFDRHSEVVHAGEETLQWKQISLKLMSEESSDEESGTITVHQPAWRSSGKFPDHVSDSL